MDCFCVLKNKQIYHLYGDKLYTEFKEKATEKFYFSHEYFDDYYVCPLDEILPEIEEAFNLRFLVLSDAYGTGDVESSGTVCDDGIIFHDAAWNGHPGWVNDDRDTIMKKLLFSEIKEFIMYKDTYIINGEVLENKKVERIVLSKEDWLSLDKKYDRRYL